MFLSRNERIALDMFEEGKTKSLLKLISRKLQKAKTREQIIDELELDDADIKFLDNFADYEYLLQ